MAKSFSASFLISIFLLIIASSAFSYEIGQIGVVDFKKIFKESSAGKIVIKKLNQKKEEYTATLKAARDLLEEDRQRIQTDSLVLSLEKKDEKEREFRIQLNDFKSMQKEFRQELIELERNSLRGLQSDVMKIVQRIGKEKNFLLVLEKNNAGILFCQPSLDITNLIIQEYNKKMANKNIDLRF